MKKQLHKINAIAALIILGSCQLAFSQINPTVRTLPVYENFGTTVFTTMPTGFVSGMVSNAPIATQSAAQSSSATASASLATATSAQTNGGSYGYANAGDAKFYVQHSASTSTGTNQLIMAINTTYWHSILISYGVEMLNANPRTAGLILQYRVGTTGAWTTISGSAYSHSSADRTNGAIDNFTNLTLPTAAENKPVVQLRWASWRGTQTGNSSGVAVDNVSVSASPQGLPTNISASTASSCSQLFLSELVSDTTGNLGVEVYNPTSAAINLSGYYLTVSSGTNTPTYFPLSGTVQSYSTFVVVNGKSPSSWLRSKANLLNGINYTYKEIIGLVYSTNPMVSVQMIDMIGDPNGTPTNNGWVVSSFGDTATTKNHDLTRLNTVTGGNLEWAKAKYEYYPHPMGTYGFLDWHSGVCAVQSLPVVSFDASGYAVNMCSAQSNTDVTFGVTLTGQSDPWSNPILPIIYDFDHFSETQYNCSAVFSPNLATYSTDYTFNSSTQGNFPPDSTGGGTYNQTFVVTVNYLATAPVNQIYACFAIQPYSSYDVDQYAYYSNLTIQGCAYMGIQSIYNSTTIRTYPNPFGNQITIENRSQTPITKVNITDMLGREVLNTKPEQTSTIIINTQSLESGMYFIKVSNNSVNFTLKMLKE